MNIKPYLDIRIIITSGIQYYGHSYGHYVVIFEPVYSQLRFTCFGLYRVLVIQHKG